SSAGRCRHPPPARCSRAPRPRRAARWTPPWSPPPRRGRPAGAPGRSSLQVLVERAVEVADATLLVASQHDVGAARFEPALDPAHRRRVLVEDTPEVAELGRIGPAL